MRQLHEMLKFASEMLPGIVKPRHNGPGQNPSFTVRIPENHPKAEALVKLFKFLETRVVMPSGIQIQRPAPVTDPVGEFLSMLRERHNAATVCERRNQRFRVGYRDAR